MRSRTVPRFDMTTRAIDPSIVHMNEPTPRIVSNTATVIVLFEKFDSIVPPFLYCSVLECAVGRDTPRRQLVEVLRTSSAIVSVVVGFRSESTVDTAGAELRPHWL
jgi:hypothetical protein